MKFPKTPLDNWIQFKIGSKNAVLTRRELQNYQLERLQATLDLVYNYSAFYRERLRDLPKPILTHLGDFSQIPFTTAGDLKDHGLQMICVSQGEIHRVVTLDSSGTTGPPKRLYFTLADQELTVDYFKIGMSTLTNAGDRVMILLPGERPGSVGDLLAISLERLGAVAYKHGLVKSLPGTIQRLADTGAEVAVGTPIQMLALAKFYEWQGGLEPVKLRRILLSTDYLARAVSKEIQRIFGCEIFDQYGMTEMGLGGGIECGAHQGCHLREADLYVEVIDPFSGKALPEGEYGEVVFTTLTRTGMPLLRYRTGDRSRWLAGNCPCGSVLSRLESIRMRQNGMILLGEADYLSLANLDEQLLALPGVIDFKAALTGLGRRSALTIEVMALGESLPCDEIEAALEKVDSVRRARQSNNLDLTINLFHCNADFIPGIGKRNISVI